MKPGDVPKCVEHLAAHPVLGPRYGSAIEYLPTAIRSVLGLDSCVAVIFEEIQGSTTRFLGTGLSVFVSDEFLQEFKTTPRFWLGPELAKRIACGNSPLLSDVAVRDANSTVGLNLLVWHCTIHPADMNRPEVGVHVMAAFAKYHLGFRLREFIVQSDCFEHFVAMQTAGGLYFHQVENYYANFPEITALNFGNEPRHIGMSRDMGLSGGQGASWGGSLFVYYERPQFCFSRSEQRLLLAALDGGTDEELSEELSISLAAVKKEWRMIYDRVAASHPELVPTNAYLEGLTQDRGKQKKQRLLAYLREHPEELRPVSRKLLQQEAARRRSAQGAKVAFDHDN